METILLRKASLQDWPKVQAIGKSTFEETFAADNSSDDMQQYLSQQFSEEKLREELNELDSEFYLALEQENVVGYLKVNTAEAQTENQHKEALEIERIYVKKEFHGKKVGQLLYAKALAIAKERKAPYIWLGVWEENARAIRFYQKNGFEEFGKHVFRLGDDEQTDIMMKKKLS